MASKRLLKKSINNLTMDLVSECYTYKFFHPTKNQDKADEAIENIVKLRNDLIQKVNNSMEPKNYKKNRSHFRVITKELTGMVTRMDGMGS